MSRNYQAVGQSANDFPVLLNTPLISGSVIAMNNAGQNEAKFGTIMYREIPEMELTPIDHHCHVL